MLRGYAETSNQQICHVRRNTVPHFFFLFQWYVTKYRLLGIGNFSSKRNLGPRHVHPLLMIRVFQSFSSSMSLAHLRIRTGISKIACRSRFIVAVYMFIKLGTFHLTLIGIKRQIHEEDKNQN